MVFRLRKLKDIYLYILSYAEKLGENTENRRDFFSLCLFWGSLCNHTTKCDVMQRKLL